MGIRVNSSRQSDEPRKRLSRLRSVKVTNLDKFRLSVKRTKSRLSQQIVLLDDSMEMGLEQKQTPTSKFQDSPNYMKATSCFSARSGSSHLNPGKSTKGIKRMYSLKRLRKLPSMKYEMCDNAEISSGGDEIEGSITMGPAKLKLIGSGSIKLTRVRSIKVSRRQWSKSRLDQASIFMPDDESADPLSSELELQKPMNNSVRTLWKMPSLRTRRRQVKKQSKFDVATCSSALKRSKIPVAGDFSGVCESENQLTGHLCPYTYCSLHGHLHSPLPPLKDFISTKRRLLKKQRSVRAKRKTKIEANCSRDVPRMKQQSIQEVSLQQDADALSSQGSNEEAFVEVYSKFDSFTDNGKEAGDFGSTMCSVADAESIKSDEQSLAPDSTSILFDSRKSANMWKLIYKHLSVGRNEEMEKAGQKGKGCNADTVDFNMNQDHQDENQDLNLDNQVADSEKVEFNQAEAIEFVQQAVDEILHLDEQSSLYPISKNMVLNQVGSCRYAEEPADPAKELKEIQLAKSGVIGAEEEDTNEGKKPIRQRSKGFEKLRKMMITAKFIKAVEKLRRINPRKPRFLSPEEMSKVEKVQLRHLSMDGRKNTEEWMLDFALQQVIAKLAPAQQRRVGMLVEAFESVKPEMNVKSERAKMPRANHSAATTDVPEEERSVALDPDTSGSCDNIVHDPERKLDLHASAAAANCEDIAGDSEVNSASEETSFFFDKEKFTNVWHMVYRQFIAQEVTLSGEKKVEQDQDGNVTASSNIEGSDSKLDTKLAAKTDPSVEIKQADAIQLVQEAIDELLVLHEKLSDQKPSKSCNVPEQNESTDPAEESNITRDASRGDNQKALQRQTSKPISKLKKMILSAKFINTMEKLSKIRTCKVEEFSSEVSGGAETVCLRHSSVDERRNGEEWMLDYALQQVISKLAPAQQKRVALLTKAFETFTPEIEQMSTKYSHFKVQLQEYTASTTTIQKHEDDNVLKSDDLIPQDSSVIPVSIIQQADCVAENIEGSDIKSHISNQTNTKGFVGCASCFSGNTQIESKEDPELKTKHHPNQEQTLVGSHGVEHVLEEGKYSKMWQLIYQHVKSNISADSESQTAEKKSKEDQSGDASLEITQSDAIKLVQEAVDGILQQQSINISPDEDGNGKLKILDAKGSEEKNEEGSRSKQNAFQGYNKLRRAIICSKFVKAMEKMQKLHIQKKRSHYNPLIQDHEVETVHLRQCLMDERSNSEVWMLDYALRQVISKLAPVQQRKVAVLIEAFETVGPNTEETTREETECKKLSVPSDIAFTAGNEDFRPSNAEQNGEGDTQSQEVSSQCEDNGKGTNTLDGKKCSSMWRLIYQHIKSGIPDADADHVPTEIDVSGPTSDAEMLDEEMPCDSANTELQQNDAIKFVEEAVNEILEMQVQNCDDQSTDPEEKTIEEDKASQELPRSYSVMSKAILCKKFIKAIEKRKKSKSKVGRCLPQQSDLPAESVRLRAQRMNEKNCEELMLDYALQQVIGKLAPTQKKKVSMLVEAYERVNPPSDSKRKQRINVVA